MPIPAGAHGDSDFRRANGNDKEQVLQLEMFYRLLVETLRTTGHIENVTLHSSVLPVERMGGIALRK